MAIIRSGITNSRRPWEVLDRGIVDLHRTVLRRGDRATITTTTMETGIVAEEEEVVAGKIIAETK